METDINPVMDIQTLMIYYNNKKIKRNIKQCVNLITGLLILISMVK